MRALPFRTGQDVPWPLARLWWLPWQVQSQLWPHRLGSLLSQPFLGSPGRRQRAGWKCPLGQIHTGSCQLDAAAVRKCLHCFYFSEKQMQNSPAPPSPIFKFQSLAQCFVSGFVCCCFFFFPYCFDRCLMNILIYGLSFSFPVFVQNVMESTCSFYTKTSRLLTRIYLNHRKPKPKLFPLSS